MLGYLSVWVFTCLFLNKVGNYPEKNGEFRGKSVFFDKSPRMNKPPQKNGWLVWVGLVIVIAAIAGVFALSKPARKSLPVIGQISGFNLTNQNGEAVALPALLGKVWVADIIFTRCAGPCPTMTHHLAELQSALPANEPVRLVTLSEELYAAGAQALRHAFRR